MIVAYIELETKNSDRYEYKIVTDKKEENFDCEPAKVYLESPISIEIMKAFANDRKEITVNNQKFKIVSICTNPIFDAESERFKQKMVDFTKETVEIYVYKKTAVCPKCKRNGRKQGLVNVIATISCLLNRNDTCEIEVQFCEQCGLYFIEEQSLAEYEKRYGLLLFERNRIIDEGSAFDEYNYEFSKDTILSRYGYSAQSNLLTTETRRAILTFLIDSGYKNEIKNLLSSFIFYRGEKCYKACPIWQSDLDFVNYYNSENDDYVGFGKLFYRK